MAASPEDIDDSLPRRRPRRRITIWTLLAPVGAVVLFIACFSAISGSCLPSSCGSDDKAEETDGPPNDLKQGARAKIKPGDSVGSIAAKYNLSEDEIKACNPTVDSQNIQPGQFLIVSAVDCDGADLAPAGSNPDPLAGETAATGATKTNATAAADPSATPPSAGAATDDAAAADGSGATDPAAAAPAAE